MKTNKRTDPITPPVVTVEVRFVWKEITEDGLMKTPEESGPYWSSDNVCGPYDSFETEEAAVEYAKKLCGQMSYFPWGNLVLIKQYNFRKS